MSKQTDITGASPWVIISADPHDLGGDPLYWSNEQGWVDKESAGRFTYSERCTLRLPIHGAWVREAQS